jgi:hypothetical protein
MLPARFSKPQFRRRWEPGTDKRVRQRPDQHGFRKKAAGNSTLSVGGVRTIQAKPDK